MNTQERRYKRYRWWPIRLKWLSPPPNHKPPWFRTHGIEVGADGIGKPVFARVVHFGRLKLIFGR